MMKRIIFSLILLLSSFQLVYAGTEICGNGIDDDGDLLIDLLDSLDCSCTASSTDSISILYNTYFEDKKSCPMGTDKLIRLEHWENQSSYFGKDAWADYFHHCATAPLQITKPNLDDYPTDPEGNVSNGIVGTIWYQGWREGFGQCLKSKLHADAYYEFNVDIACTTVNEDQDDLFSFCGDSADFPDDFDSIDVTIYGHADCYEFPLKNYLNECPTESPFNWIDLGHFRYDPQAEWSRRAIRFKAPADIQSIMIAAPCNLEGTNFMVANYGCANLFLFDNLILNADISKFETTISSSGHLCMNDLVLTGTPDTIAANSSFLWYKDGVALIKENTTQLKISEKDLGTGLYTLRFGFDGPTYNATNFLVSQYDIDLELEKTDQNSSLACDGQISAAMDGGEGPFQVIWSTNIDTIFDVPQNITISELNLCAGDYGITIIDANECIDSTSITLGYTCTDSINGTVLGHNKLLPKAMVYLYYDDSPIAIDSTNVEDGVFGFQYFCHDNYVLKAVALGDDATRFDKTYYFSRTLFDSAYSIGMTGTVFDLNIRLIPAVGIFDSWLDNIISMQPNPASDIISINTGSASNHIIRVNIISKHGELVAQHNGSSAQKEIDLSQFENGIYFVQVITDEGKISKKVVLIK
ncbi:MAG: T9SS type A sorting domain-containing protein [Flavobacteriales bacterium]|nr:T9SS type A sorting domain-containing protein [Flavobacteriales bacterium]